MHRVLSTGADVAILRAARLESRGRHGLPDQIPPAADTKNLAGNHVIIACNDVNVALAHMQNGSVAVQTGQRVATGDLHGRVGNSGNTSEPHLHIHAVQASIGDVFDGDGVPLLFDDQFPVRNSTFSEK